MNLLNLLTKNKDIPVPFKTFLQENKYLHFSYKISSDDLTGKILSLSFMMEAHNYFTYRITSNSSSGDY